MHILEKFYAYLLRLPIKIDKLPLLLFIILSSLLLSRIVNAIIQYRILDAGKITVSQPKLQKEPEKTVAYYEDIKKRNIFNSSAKGEIPPRVASSKMETLSSSSLRLIGTVAGSDSIAYAVFEDPSTKKQVLFKVGDDVFNVGKLIKVERRKAFIQQDGTVELVAMPIETWGKNIKGSDALLTAVGEKSQDSTSQQGKQQSSVIEEKDVSMAMNSPHTLLSQMRIVPNLSEGKPDGFRLVSVAPGSLVEKIGLKSGDIIKSINGMELNTMDQIYETLQNLKSEKFISIDIIRENRRITLNYRVE